MLSEKIQLAINKEVAKYPIGKQQSAVIAALALVQAESGYVDKSAMADIAKVLAISTMEVYEVASFYNMFDTKPRGKYKITMCTNLPCALSGANEAFAYLCEKLGLDNKGGTTKDNLWTIAQGECFGACGSAPVVLVNNNEMKIKMNKMAINELINTINANRGAQ